LAMHSDASNQAIAVISGALSASCLHHQLASSCAHLMGTEELAAAE